MIYMGGTTFILILNSILILEEFENRVGYSVPERLDRFNQFVCQMDRPPSSLDSIRGKEIISLACTVTRLSLMEGLSPSQTLLNLSIEEVSYE